MDVSNSKLFSALSDPTRLKVLEFLKGGDYVALSDIQAHIGIGQSGLSFHIAALKNAGLLAYDKRGKRSFYRIKVEQLEPIKQYLASYTGSDT